MNKFSLLLVLLLSTTSVFGMNTDSIRSYVYCVEGYKFLYVFTSKNTQAGISVTQIYKPFNNFGNPPIPMKCDGKEPYQVKREPMKYEH